MPFVVYDQTLHLLGKLRAPLATLATRDKPLAIQLKRAASSIALNLAEGNRRHGQDRRHLFRIAAGSAAEVKAALDVACAFGDLDHHDTLDIRRTLDGILAMLWRLAR